MSQTVTLEEAQARLPELIARLSPGDDLVILQNERAIAHLQLISEEKPQPVFGSCKGKLIMVSEDDSHLEDFNDYMP
ncbi:MAG TPA: hypothetical protein PLL06_08165 [Acidobacteriota bacterium]|nr:hypothetical protein [Acidobacteriota bacterium]HNG92982.1 hypothetical protein [Acidobacteriota bacterium]HNJ43988.1 hypothetical protein [Acidobacteriota bacterium]